MRKSSHPAVSSDERISPVRTPTASIDADTFSHALGSSANAKSNKDGEVDTIFTVDNFYSKNDTFRIIFVESMYIDRSILLITVDYSFPPRTRNHDTDLLSSEPIRLISHAPVCDRIRDGSLACRQARAS